MSIFVFLDGYLSQNYEELYFFVWWNFEVDEDTFWKISFGRIFILPPCTPLFINFSCTIRPLINVVYAFMVFISTLNYFFYSPL
ncbi:hypothetical protein LguiB_004930 [Lonicera macranthoides]